MGLPKNLHPRAEVQESKPLAKEHDPVSFAKLLEQFRDYSITRKWFQDKDYSVEPAMYLSYHYSRATRSNRIESLDVVRVDLKFEGQVEEDGGWDETDEETRSKIIEALETYKDFMDSMFLVVNSYNEVIEAAACAEISSKKSSKKSARKSSSGRSSKKHSKRQLKKRLKQSSHKGKQKSSKEKDKDTEKEVEPRREIEETDTTTLDTKPSWSFSSWVFGPTTQIKEEPETRHGTLVKAKKAKKSTSNPNHEQMLKELDGYIENISDLETKLKEEHKTTTDIYKQLKQEMVQHLTRSQTFAQANFRSEESFCQKFEHELKAYHKRAAALKQTLRKRNAEKEVICKRLKTAILKGDAYHKDFSEIVCDLENDIAVLDKKKDKLQAKVQTLKDGSTRVLEARSVAMRAHEKYTSFVNLVDNEPYQEPPRTSPLRISDKRLQNTPSEFSVVVPPGKMGVIFKQRGTKSAVVTQIKPSSNMVGKVSVGDSLISIDGEDVSKKSLTALVGILAQKETRNRLLVFIAGGAEDKTTANVVSPDGRGQKRSHSEALSSISSTNSARKMRFIPTSSDYEISLTPHPDTKLGFKLIAPIDGRPPYVNAFDEDFEAHKSIKLGDELLSVNGVALANKSEGNVLATFDHYRKQKKPIKLKFRRVFTLATVKTEPSEENVAAPSPSATT